MGSGGKQTHATYATAPTAAAGVEKAEATAGPGGAETAGQEHLKKAQNLIAILQYLVGNGPAFFASPQDPEDDGLELWYSELQQVTAKAGNELLEAQKDGADAEAIAEQRQQLKDATAAALAQATVEQLQQLAAQEGFAHPQLVGLNHQEGDTHPLAHWLDPAYPDTASKAKIQAKALERYQALCAGHTVAGLTLADVSPAASPSGTWVASKEEFEQLKDAFAAQIDTYEQLDPDDVDARGAALAKLVNIENQLATAQCPELATAVPFVQGAAAQQVEFFTYNLAPTSAVFDQALDQAEQAGVLTAEQRSVLAKPLALDLARYGTSAEEKEEIAQTAADRLQTVAQLQSAFTGLSDYVGADNKLKFPPAADPTDPYASAQPAHKMASLAQQYTEAETLIHSWADELPGGYEKVTGLPTHPLSLTELTANFNAWAVGSSTQTVKQAAAALGLKDISAANKADAKKFIAAHWDPGLDKGAVQAAVTKKAASPPPSGPKKHPGTAPLSTTTATPTAPKAGAASTTTTTGFAGKHAALVAALQHHGAAFQEVPKRLDSSVVANHDFGPGSSAVGLGGAHTKSFHTGPDGGKWLFKPDHQGKGARAHAEAAASQIYAAAGIPAVPVYTATVGGKKGVVQPMVPNAQPLTPNPTSWSQADVDAMVRTHVAQWVIGDHDGNPANILKTASGGLVPIDAGQAFKHYGTDTLSISYHPNASYGAAPPAHQQAYKAFLSGELATGVKIKPSAAHPVIKKLESIPDSQWRAMLHSTAYEGAKNPALGWVPTMRQRAAKKHKIAEAKVTPSQIAEAFLDEACHRKNTLRDSFAKFFTNELHLDGATLKYGA